MRVLFVCLIMAAVPSWGGPVQNVSFLYSAWMMRRPTSDALGDRTAEQYHSVYIKLTSRRWKDMALQVQVPYFLVNQTLADDTRYSRFGLTDLELTLDRKIRWLTLALSTGVPLGYRYAASGEDHVWLGSASLYLKPVVRVGTWYAPFKAGAGLETRFRWYLQDGAVARGGREGGIKGYVIRQVKRAVAGLSLDLAWQELSYYTVGSGGDAVYAAPVSSYDFNAGLFVSYTSVSRRTVSAGMAVSLYQQETAPGNAGWVQISVPVPERK